ncbi:MAG TPA: adenylate/guanylate cyclase domain-containing protein [Anaerolineales bacterium]
MSISLEQLTQLEAAIANLEAQRAVLGDSVIELALAPLRQQLADLRLTVLQSPASALEGERKLVTVMFADISGFTALSERNDPEQVRALVNACFTWLVPIIEKYGGVVEKFIGDEIMAMFGAPIAHENDAERALRASLEMMDALVKFNQKHLTSLGMHFGINTGIVVAGGLGSDGRQQYGVMGDTVNVAARLEDASETGQILVGPNTYRLTTLQFEFETVPPIRVKGKIEPVPVYHLLSLKAEPGSPRGIEGLRSPLIGRDAELAQLQIAVRGLQAGQGRTVALIGEAGLGKSRLAAEMHQALPKSLTWAEGRALSYTEGISYWIVRDLLCALIGIRADTPLLEVGMSLQKSIERLFPEETQAAEIYPYLARLLDAPLDEATAERVKYLTPEAWQGRMFQAFREYLRTESQAKPLVLVWEDLHWADPSSLRLLETLLPLTKEIPLLLLLIFRSRLEGQVWQFHERMMSEYATSYEVINLSPLSSVESTQLVQRLLKLENLPEEIRQLILDKAEGNPFFLEELLRSLLDAGIVVLEKDKTIVTRDVKELEIPDTLQGVIAARIDRLPLESKRTLQTASVIGRIFQQRVLTYLFQQERASIQLDGALSELRRRELINLRQIEALRKGEIPADLEYIFKHAITQETAYNSLLITRRKTLHKVAAEAIETLFPNYLDELAATLAYHFERAGIAHKAIHYLTRAADRAKATYANAEAIASYQRAISQVKELLDNEKDVEIWRKVEVGLLESLGDVLELTAQHVEAIDAYQRALAQVPQDDIISQSRLQRKTGIALEFQRLFEDALRAYSQAEATLGQEPVNSISEWWNEWLMIHLDRMRLRYWQGQVQEMIQLAEKVRPSLDAYGTPLQRSKFFTDLVAMALRRDRYVVSEETLTHAQDAVAAAQESENLGEIAWAQFMRGFSQLWHGDLDDAEAQLQAALELAEQIGDVTLQSRCLTYLTITDRKRGQVKEVRDTALRSLAVATGGKMPEYISMAKGNLAWVARRQGNLAEAQELGQAAFDLFKQTVQGQMFPWVVLWPLIGTRLAQNQIAEAIEYVRGLFTPTGQLPPDTLVSVLEASIQSWEGGQPEKTHAYLIQASELAQQMGYL